MRRLPRPLLAASLTLLLALPLHSQERTLSLEEARTLAGAASEAVRIRALDVERTRAAVGEAASRVLPHLDVAASASYLPNPPKGVTVSKGQLGSIAVPGLGAISVPTSDLALFNDTPSLYYKLSVSLSQPLFTWGKIRSAVDLAGLQVEISGALLAGQRRDIEREVSRAYFGALLAGESAEELARIREALAGTVEDRRKSFEEGSITRENVLEAVANLAGIDARIVEARESRQSALQSLGILTGLDTAALKLSTGFRGSAPEIDEAAAQRRAAEASTDLAVARARISQGHRKLDIARGGGMLRPDLSFQVSLDMDNAQKTPASGAPNWTSDWEWNLALSLGVKMSAFDGLEGMNRTAQAEKELAMAAEALSQQEKLLRISVRRAVETVARAGAQVRAREAAAAYAVERNKNARVSVESGLASRQDLRGADVLAGTAAIDLLLARYTLEEALADLARLSGERL